MNDENETQNNSNGSQYLPSLYAIDGSCIDEHVTNNNFSFINVEEGNYYDQLQSINNSSTNNYVIGFSAGGKPAVEASANAISNGVNINGIFVVDDGIYHLKYKKYSDALQTIAKNNTDIYFISRRLDGSNYDYLKLEAQEYAKTAGTAFLITNNGTKGHGTGADQIYARIVNDNLVGYFNGYGQLTNTEDYTFEVFDNATQTWSTYNYDQFQAKVDSGEIELNDNVLSQIQSTDPSAISFSAGEIVDSDKEELLTYLNDIRKNLTLEVIVNTYNSTTAIPNSESKAIQQFFKGTQRLFEVIAADTEFILNSANSLEELDKILSERAENLGSSTTLGKVITGIVAALSGITGFLMGGIWGAAGGVYLSNQAASLIGKVFGIDTTSTQSTTASSTSTASTTISPSKLDTFNSLASGTAQATTPSAAESDKSKANAETPVNPFKDWKPE